MELTRELTGKTALVTGSTGGIGAETAKLLAAAGAEVVVSGRNAERGAATVQAITDSGGTARFIAAELTDLASLRQLADAAGEVDILVNNAGVFPGAPTVEQDVETFDAVLAANIRAPYFLTAALAPGMVARGSGSIINVSTMAASIGIPGLSVYSASKAALESLTRSWAAEFSPAGVRVNTVSPGPTRTDTILTTVGEDAAQQFADTTLLGRLAAPREIAEAILFLATDRAGYITGANLAVDAGRTAV
ncbi:SDR family NAD(P)-dependent oxidoreductase [Kitasatospora kifunensis]|uniref:NAD(P)-dependent dehydrogenase (Short-subunit alcohol dehydrogenase family) n=1 Tax=Kitasatospora kifunensis TaxID=58351 RepID=A0A7W7R8J5_KITKI|nr:SDR family oxidoreductase [Kitasatospora kifunensis]MBB4927393.1 NAD(P)-dependent dehydrogenase (short-subunit alcohol dehydrogenase family) [Kitasatospora kifunensis]